MLGERPGLLADDRLRLVGIRSADPNQRLRGGAHFVSASGTGPSQGFVTAACMAAEEDGWIGLGLLAGGDRRHGERLIAASPVYNEAVEVEVGSPHRVDRRTPVSAPELRSVLAVTSFPGRTGIPPARA